MLRKTIASAFIAGAAILGLAAPATAAPSTAPKVIGVSSSVHVTGDGTAYVHGTYRCYGDFETHLWVSAKQGSTSGFAADAWWDTNYNSDPNTGAPLQTATCDGTVHNVRITIKPTPFKPTGDLQKGVDTYIQFCLVVGEDEESAIVDSQMFWGTTV